MNETQKPSILLLGTFHMRPTTDMHAVKVKDLSSLQRQGEIMELVERLKSFEPTKLAFEIETHRNTDMNAQYRQYRSGDLELEISEAHQLGFRIAASLQHEHVHCIDWMGQGGGTKGVGDIYEWARDHQPDLFEELFGNLDQGFGNREIETQSILEMYRYYNDPTLIKKQHTMYINMARIGEMGHYVGMEWLTWWYQRNLILFSNLARIATSPDDRVLLIIGAGHIQILSRFLEESELFDIVSANQYLA